jgi:hypothetical protein
MNALLGPLDSNGRVPPAQQTRVAAFLVSAHGALARQFALVLPGRFKAGWETELNAQFFHESEIVSLLLRATSWQPAPALTYLAMGWELAWWPQPVEGVPDPNLAWTIDLSALAHAVHAAIRPAALLPVQADPQDAFVMALRRIELESSRMLQAQIVFLKGQDLLPYRAAVTAAVERRHAEVRGLWIKTLEGAGIDDSASR